MEDVTKIEDVTKVEVCAGCGKHWTEHYGPKLVEATHELYVGSFGLIADHVPYMSNRDPGDEHDG